MTVVKEKAYAKINLYLDVLGIRDDGFHDIKTVMHSVTLADDIIVSVTPARKLSIRLSVEGNRFLPSDTKNLAYKAALMFMERLGVAADVNIKLVKRIPVSAGLAGGSTDAAATFRALNKIYKRPFTFKTLLKMGAELGSDVPYCILGKTALCEGRGERITKIDTDLKLDFIIANSGEHVSTPDAYRALDERYSSFDGSVSYSGEEKLPALMNMLANSSFNKDALYNIFEEPILAKCSRSALMKKRLEELGAMHVMMSGSGPSLFAVFTDKKTCEMAKSELVMEGFFAWCARSV